ncbi:hypothetical protein VIGAN_07167600 [Vigna angularis var. angularis]|uniref:PWWP domain-containing protein n=1 Tax=Vigna angularis var. angularis TaxID=157739 RepID=A0A0S3SJ49_PHAAN|nr:uncharacterized protein LOC108333184 [Vigna angularis]BAT92832.1 hypothetical protein VIGAN_07167600 [Vigna angularis var. angularis]
MESVKKKKMKRGDMVWVRFPFCPRKWLPALVLSSDNLGLNVTCSFSYTKKDTVFPSSYVSHSEILPFEEAFPFIAKRDEVDLPLLHSALRFFGRRIISGLRCRCLTGLDGPDCSSGFDPTEVLGFVLDAAVSPSVELPSFARAVRVVAQVHAYRSCCSLKHKKLYKETKIAGDKLKLIPSSILGQKRHLVTQESVALESLVKCQIVSKNQQSKKVLGAMKRLISTVPVWEVKSAQLFFNRHPIISESFIDCPSLEPLYMLLERLKSSRQSLLGFKKISDRGLVDISFENIDTMSKTHILVPSNFMIHLRNYIDEREDNGQELCWRLPDKDIIVYLNRKRRRLDKSASCHVLPQTSGVQESERDAYILKHTRPRISDIKMPEPEGSIQKGIQASTYVCETNVNFTDKARKVDSTRSQNCESLSNLAFDFHSDNCEVDAGAAKGKGILGSDSSLYQESLQMSCNSVTTTPSSEKSEGTELFSEGCLVEGKDRFQGVASSKFNSKAGQLSRTHVPSCCKSLHMKFPKNFNLPSKEELLKKFSVVGSVDSSKTRVFFYCGSAEVCFLQEGVAVAAYKYAKRKALFGTAKVQFWLDPFEPKRRGFQRSAHVPLLKSCLKKSNTLRKESRKKERRVRFECCAHVPPLASKQTGPPLKSCLKNSSTLGKDSRKKQRRVRFTIVT